jgi:hypothetical protein
MLLTLGGVKAIIPTTYSINGWISTKFRPFHHPICPTDGEQDTFGLVSLSDQLLDPSHIGSIDYVEAFDHNQFNPE